MRTRHRGISMLDISLHGIYTMTQTTVTSAFFSLRSSHATFSSTNYPRNRLEIISRVIIFAECASSSRKNDFPVVHWLHPNSSVTKRGLR